MILKDGTDTSDYKRPGKYCDPMAVVLDSIWMIGDMGDEDVTWEGGPGYVRYGRRILSWDTQGFVSSYTYDTRGEAEGFMADLARELVDYGDEVVS